MFDSLYQDDVDRALRLEAQSPRVQPKKEAGVLEGLGGAVWRGAAQGAVETARAGLNLLEAYGKSFAYTEGAPREESIDRIFEQSEASKALGGVARSFDVDPETIGAAGQIVHGLAKFGTKAVGYGLTMGPLAPVGFGVDEGISEGLRLSDKGVDTEAAIKAGVVHGGAAAASIALPVAGKTVAQTAGLTAVGGPGAFMAEQATIREILDNAGHVEIGREYDPFDVTGLVVSTLGPGAFGAGVHAARGMRARRAAAKPGDAPAPETGVPTAGNVSPDAPRVDADAYPREAVDAALVRVLSDAEDAAALVKRTDVAGMRQHVDAVRAVEDAINTGIRGIEERIAGNMRELARQDKAAWRSMTQGDRLERAAQMARDQLLAEAEKRKQRTTLQLGAVGRILAFVDEQVARGVRPFEALFRHLEQTDVYAKGVRNQYFSELVAEMSGIHGRLMGLMEDSRVSRAITQEIFGVDSGNAIAKRAARAWLDTIEGMRQRFNAAGGDVGKLDYGYIPQPHDSTRVLQTGAQQWSEQVLPLIDRARYVHEDGRSFTDAELREFLMSAWQSIATDGLNKIEPGQHRGSMLANRGSKSRQIHFAGPTEYLAYMREYGRRGVIASMHAHVGRLARDIALLERMGPNPDNAFKTVYDELLKTGDTARAAGKVVDMQAVWDTMSGKLEQPKWALLADTAQGWRNYQVASKLGSAVLSSVGDLGTLVVTARFHKLPTIDLVRNVVRAFGKGDQEFANRAGLVADTLISDMNRWAEGNIGPGWTGKAAGLTMRLSLMNAWTDTLRRGFSVTMMGALGRLSRLDWNALDAADRAHMQRVGVTQADFDVWRLGQPEDWRGSKMLTPQAIRAIPDAALERFGNPQQVRDIAVTKLLGYITDESEFAIVNPDLITRTIRTGGSQKGTASGEMWRSIMLFKSFPIAMITRHWRRMADDSMTTGQRLAYGATLLTALEVLGYVAMTLKDLRDGKDPRDITDPRTWAAALMHGGGLGIMGDFMFSDVNRYGSSFTESLAGPLFSTVSDLFRLTWGNVQQAAKGEETDAGAELLQFLRGNTPLVNLWYTKAAVERAFLHDMQEAMSPGYLRRMTRRARREFNQEFWWQPGEMVPDRAPDFGAIAGN